MDALRLIEMEKERTKDRLTSLKLQMEANLEEAEILRAKFDKDTEELESLDRVAQLLANKGFV